MGALLAEGQVAAENGEAGGGEGLRERDEERGLAVGSGSVGEDERGARRTRGRLVEEATDRRDRAGIGGEIGVRLHGSKSTHRGQSPVLSCGCGRAGTGKVFCA